MTADLLSQVWAQPAQRPELTLPEWESLLGQARQARLLGRLAQHHQEHDWLPRVPAQPRQYLEGALRLVARQQQEVRWEVGCIGRALQQVDAPVVLLKGAAYLLAALPPQRGRLFADIDLLVPRERLAEVEGALFRAGWISDERDAYNQRYYRQWMHEIPPMRHVQRGTVIDLHHTITPPTSRFKVDGAALLERIVPMDGRAGWFFLAPEDMVLHSAVHLFQEGDFSHGLRDLLDLDDLLRHFGQSPGFGHALFLRARELGLGEPLWHVLQQTARLFGSCAPPGFPRAWPGSPSRRLSRRLLLAGLALAMQPCHPSCDGHLNGVARWLLYVRSHYLRMPWYLAMPHLARKAWRRYLPQKKTAP